MTGALGTLAAAALYILSITAVQGLMPPEVLARSTSPFAAAARRVCEGDRLIRAGLWREVAPDFLLGREVTGKVLGIVGFGRIGQAVARRAE